MSQCPISRLSCILCSVFKVRFWVEPKFQPLILKDWNLISTVKSEKWIMKSLGVGFADQLKYVRSANTFSLLFSLLSLILILVGLNGLEPSTSRLSGGRSNLLSYKPIFLSRFNSFLGCFSVPRGYVLVRVQSPLVEIIGIEPMTPCLQSRCSPSWAIPP